MAGISFSVFYDAIKSGKKPHTIRFRDIPPIVGENLFLWWKSRSKDRRFIGTTVCTKVQSIVIDRHLETVSLDGSRLSSEQIEKLALSDGFSSVEAFWSFFSGPIPEKPGFLIHWNPDYISGETLRSDVLVFAELTPESPPKNSPKYAPSNGTEGMGFTSQWCDNCDRNKGVSGSCPVLLKALCSSTEHWIVYQSVPLCTQFVPVEMKSKHKAGKKQKQLERKGQMNLLNG